MAVGRHRSPSILSPPFATMATAGFGWQTLGQTCSRGDPGSAICVQRLDDSLNSAIHTRYRSLLRSSSMHEPRDPPSEVVNFLLPSTQNTKTPKGLKRFKDKRPKAGGLGSRPVGRLTSVDLSATHRPHTSSEPISRPPVASARCFTVDAQRQTTARIC